MRACRWLKNTKRCGVVIAEPSAASEQPDAIGFDGTSSHVVECKTSRSDLLRDRKKRHRRHRSGLGHYRWMMMTRELAEACGDVMAEHYQGWGLLGTYQGLRCVAMLAEPHRYRPRDRDVHGELAIALAELRKHDDPRYQREPERYRFRWLGEQTGERVP